MFPANSGSLPWVQNALNGWEQTINLDKVTQIVDSSGYVTEILQRFAFKGVIQPFSPRELQLKPEGERAWEWLKVHTKNKLSVNPGEYVIYNGIKYRVMQSNNYNVYGYFEYQIVNTYE
jgi:hypothetical protein